MNFSNPARKRRQPAEVNITPLVDIVFNLLIFFLITSTFVQNPGIEVDLPKASASPLTAESDNVILAVTSDGRLIFEGELVSDDELQGLLTERHAAEPTATVIIQADNTTDHGKVVRVMDLARKAGFAKLAIATEADE